MLKSEGKKGTNSQHYTSTNIGPSTKNDTKRSFCFFRALFWGIALHRSRDVNRDIIKRKNTDFSKFEFVQ